MSRRAPPLASDPLTEAAALIRDVGRSAQRARRYRALVVEVAEPIFDRALALGSDIRQAVRGSDPQPAVAIARVVAELRDLLARCESAIDGVTTSAPYREALASFSAGETERVIPLAAAIFTSVTPHVPAGALYWPVPIRGGSGVHFLPPEDCASRLRKIATEGLPAAMDPPELGGDEAIRPVLLRDDHDDSESPIALAFEPQALPAPVCHVEGSNVVLFYADRLRADFTVSCTGRVSDEWWRIRPDAYREYLDELREALGKQALRMTIER